MQYAILNMWYVVWNMCICRCNYLHISYTFMIVICGYMRLCHCTSTLYMYYMWYENANTRCSSVAHQKCSLGPSESCRRRMCPKQNMNWWQHEMLSPSGEALIVHKGPRAAGGVFGSLPKDLRIAIRVKFCDFDLNFKSNLLNFIRSRSLHLGVLLEICCQISRHYGQQLVIWWQPPELYSVINLNAFGSSNISSAAIQSIALVSGRSRDERWCLK